MSQGIAFALLATALVLWLLWRFGRPPAQCPPEDDTSGFAGG